MQARKRNGSIMSKLLMAILSVALVFTMMPLSMGTAYADTPPEGTVFTIVDTDGNEITFTMEELESSADIISTTIGGTAVEGFSVGDLLGNYDDNAVATVSTVDNYDKVKATGKTVGELKDGNYILAYREGTKDLRGSEVKDKNTGETYGTGNFYLYSGAGDRDKWVNKISLTAGTAPDDDSVVFTIVDTNGNKKTFTMEELGSSADIISTTIGDTAVEGFSVGDLLGDYDDNAVATVSTVDNYDKVKASGKTVGELKTGNYVLVYLEGTKDLRGSEVKDKNTGETYGTGNFYLYSGAGDRDKWVNKIVLTSDEPDPPEPALFLTVTGSALKSEISFATFDDFCNDASVKAKTKENVVFNWKNSYGTEGTAKVTGITIADLIQIAGLKNNVEIKEINVVSSDGDWSKTYNADTLLTPDLDGNLAMYAWTYWASDKNKTQTGQQRVIYGQFTAGEVNQSGWGREINNIEVVGEEKADDPEPTTKPATEPTVAPKPTEETAADTTTKTTTAATSSNVKKKALTEAPKIKTVSKSRKKAMIVSWNKVKGATSYKVMYRKAGASKWATKTTKKTKLWVKGLKKGNVYEFKAVSVGKNGKSEDSNTVYRYYQPAKKVSVKGKKKAIKVSWKKDKKASGYQVFYSTKKNMKGATRITIKGKKTSVKISNLKKGKRYYVKVRPYIEKNGYRYLGTMSRIKSAKAR